MLNKKKIKKIALILIVGINQIYSQNSIKVNYSVYPTGGSIEKNRDILESKLVSSFNGIDEELKKLEYELLVNNQKSYFCLISSLDFNVKLSRLAKSLAGNAEYFTNTRTKEIIKVVDFMGEKFNVLLDTNRVWTFSKETKLINNYLCYKATSQKILKLKKSNNSINITAWYCPSLPYNFGPKEYCNLPGLILELQEDKVTYIASKVQILDNAELKLKNFTGKTINELRFYEIVQESYSKTLLTLPKE